MRSQVCFPGYEVVGAVPLVQDGCFYKTRYYIKGHHAALRQFGFIRYIKGSTGPETEVLVCGIAVTTNIAVHAEIPQQEAA